MSISVSKLARLTQIPARAILSPPLAPLSMPVSSNYQSLRRSSLPGTSLHSPNDSEELTSLYTTILSGLRNNIPPEHHASDGIGGVYLLKDNSNAPAAIFKPLDEESVPSIDDAASQHVPLGKEIKPGLYHGEGYAKEIAAYLLDPEHFHNVPPTTLYHCSHPLFIKEKFMAKTGSLQKYVPHICTSEDMGWSLFPVDEVHKIGVLDCRILNTDRHMGNILVVKSGSSYRLTPIDHGLCLPSSLSEGYFEWLSFAQAKKPFSKDTLAYIARLDPDTEIRLLRKHLPFLRLDCLVTLKICTKFLQKAAKKGHTLFQIGCMMTRYLNPDEPSQLERIKMRADMRTRSITNYQMLDFWEILDDEMNKVLSK